MCSSPTAARGFSIDLIVSGTSDFREPVISPRHLGGSGLPTDPLEVAFGNANKIPRRDENRCGHGKFTPDVLARVLNKDRTPARAIGQAARGRDGGQDIKTTTVGI